MADVTMTLVELSELQNSIRTLQAEVAQLRQQLLERPVFNPDELAAHLEAGFWSSVEVVRYALANLPVDTPGWPLTRLKEVIDTVDAVATNPFQKEIGVALAQCLTP